MLDIEWVSTKPFKTNHLMEGEFVLKYTREVVAIGQYTPPHGYEVVTNSNRVYLCKNAARALVDLRAGIIG